MTIMTTQSRLVVVAFDNIGHCHPCPPGDLDPGVTYLAALPSLTKHCEFPGNSNLGHVHSVSE